MPPAKDKPMIDLKTIKQDCDVVEDGDKTAARICRINGELQQGYFHLGHFKRSVTFFGGARFVEGDVWYERVRHLANRIVKEVGFTVITGGGPGMMEAANRGAKEAGGQSIGITIKLPHEQSDNPYLTESIPFNFFFTRKTILNYAAEMYIACPGGFGTLDELMEVLTLMQTKKVAKVPVFLYGVSFWTPMLVFIKQILLKEYNTIALEDLDFFKVTDDDDEIIATLKKAHVVKGY